MKIFTLKFVHDIGVQWVQVHPRVRNKNLGNLGGKL